MKQNVTALVLALALAAALAGCSTDRTPDGNYNTRSGASAGQVSRKADRAARDYLDDGRYAAGRSGRVYGGDRNPISRDLTRDTRDLMEEGRDALDKLGRDIRKGAADLGRDLNSSGTPSWEPDSSAQR